MTQYAIEYRHMGKTYVMHLCAESQEDAEARLKSAYFNGEAQEVVWKGRVPLNPINALRTRIRAIWEGFNA